MPRTLDHLPAGKRAELAFVVGPLMAGLDKERSTCCARVGSQIVLGQLGLRLLGGLKWH